MATRNRTALFRKYRTALQQVRPASASTSAQGAVVELSNAPLLRGAASGYNRLSTVDVDGSREGVVSVGLPPPWVDVSEEVAIDMQKIRSKMGELAKAHARALMPTFDDIKGKGQEHNIELMSQDITRLLKKCEQKLRQLSQDRGHSEDMKLRVNVQRSLATDLQTLSVEFRKHQKGYLQRLQQQQQQERASITASYERGKEDEFYDPGFNEQQMSRLKKAEVLSEEREKEVQQIMESVNDLAQIMKDLSTLVIDQGTIVDRIDYNVQQVATSIEQGVRELEQAERTQKKGDMVFCVMVLIALCVFMICVLIFKKLVL
ncbi:syntaxin-41 [Selaginella moellendorffii]|uniref:syntaxin-41 n=1 Tax=Selaginella moellendorffii TaxID=88036 RepID=UPI000D1C694B|nr:syntaxin-41 [Selaginella moellendorffii]XP_024516672.1 syntaxin-41 [Selaginella moellendorffii]|eukprot:XP_024515189.1 syntaxin-41 [Selaginella moellendorffii]